MKKSLLLASAILLTAGFATAETVTIGSKEYTVERKIERQIGPGTTYLRLRLPDYPLNVNVIMVDLNDPYNRIETTVAKESSRGTELLTTAAKRQSYEGHRPLAAANANFWIVSSQPEDAVFTGITRNASIRNGKMITESNQNRDQWDGGTMRTGVVSCSYDKVLNIDYCTSAIKISSDKFGPTDVFQCNKGVWETEIGMYNSHYGASTSFIPLAQEANGKYKTADGGDATEVILDFDEGEEWRSGTPMTFVVKEVRLNAGKGTLGEHDLALVGRGDNQALLAQLAEGDKVDLVYTWTYNPGAENEVTPLVEQAVGGNALVMRNGELTEHNNNETYNSQVYSRTGYGCSQDGKTLYMVVIDKSNDPVWGGSAGCSTSVMCQIAKHLGCYNMANFDAGGSAEMMVNNEIVNKTTESSPRAVANGWMIYSIAPEDDNTVASLSFYDNVLEQPIYAAATPQIIAYNKYGAVISYDYKDITFSCDEQIGSCEGNLFIAGSQTATGTLTAHVGDVSVSKTISIVEAEVSLRVPEILIDNNRRYPIEVTATTGGKTYTYDPAYVDWTVEDESVASIDADGTLTGLKNGSTKITAKVGEFIKEGIVNVEIPTSQTLLLSEASAWAVKGSSGITGVTLAEDGATTFTYGSPRSPYLEYTLSTPFYALPDDIYTEFKSELPVSSITLAVVPANASREVVISLDPEEALAAGTDHHIEFNIGSSVALDDIAVFPIKSKRIRYYFSPSTSHKGSHTFNFGGLYGLYKHYDAIENVAVDGADTATRLRVTPNPVPAADTFTVKVPGISQVAIYTINGTLVSTSAVSPEEPAVISAPAIPGTYVVSALGNNGRSAAILIVK